MTIGNQVLIDIQCATGNNQHFFLYKERERKDQGTARQKIKLRL